ncbi:hypothetical protein Moror_15535 [Moniliophthora roreri MCA 2997]|uniref:Uncharacterized protein n=1 Tax=Moniliophthora roreri (strain MCA 2997) TaxID=1381753 RepID=V2W1L8_MONRO|nr:hypothetical protein Moror_15535 [Moniliophthora roreri MCA 2997]
MEHATSSSPPNSDPVARELSGVFEPCSLYSFTTDWFRRLLDFRHASFTRRRTLDDVYVLTIRHLRFDDPLHESLQIFIEWGQSGAKRKIRLERCKGRHNENKPKLRQILDLFAINSGTFDSLDIFKLSSDPDSATLESRLVRCITFDAKSLPILRFCSLAMSLTILAPDYVELAGADPSNIAKGPAFSKLGRVYGVRILNDQNCSFRFLSNRQNSLEMQLAVRYGLEKERFSFEMVREVRRAMTEGWEQKEPDERQRMKKEPRERIKLLQTILEQFMRKQLEDQQDFLKNLRVLRASLLTGGGI